MDNYKPTQEQIESAKSYIRQRISNQNMLEDILYDEFKKAAESIAHLILKYRARKTKLHFTGNSMMAQEIQRVIDSLEEQIDYYTGYYSIPDEADDDEEIVNTIHNHVFDDFDHGYTYEDRKTLYLSNILKALGEADFTEFDDEDTLIETIQEAIEKPSNRISLLAINSIAVGFAFYSLISARQQGYTHFVSYIGSSNPCQYCLSLNGMIQEIENYPNGGYHPRCCCYFIFF